MINLKRAYDPVASTDGTRFLVERLWPRGVKKTALHVHAWLKDVAPSTTLRRWFAMTQRSGVNSGDGTFTNWARMRKY